MKKSLLTLAIVLLAVAAQAQTAFKVHSSGQISLQSATTSYGVQIPSNGVVSFEPNITTAFNVTSQTKARSGLVKAWAVKPLGYDFMNISHSFYVLGNGDVFAYGDYLTIYPPRSKGGLPIEGASELVSLMKGYYLDTNEFDGISPEDIIDNENVKPEAVEGLLHDMELSRTAGFLAEEMEEIMPEAVRHDAEGMVGINYNAVVTVLVEAFKEQQARIEQLESILRENGLMEGKK